MSLNEKWQRRLLVLAEVIASWSKDPSTKIGAIALSKDNIIISQGFNGFPHGYPDDKALYNDREKKLNIVVHAEQNAIYHANSSDLRGGTIVCTHIPCSHCAGAMVQSGIKQLVVYEPSAEFVQRWNWPASREILRHGRVIVSFIKK